MVVVWKARPTSTARGNVSRARRLIRQSRILSSHSASTAPAGNKTNQFAIGRAIKRDTSAQPKVANQKRLWAVVFSMAVVSRFKSRLLQVGGEGTISECGAVGGKPRSHITNTRRRPKSLA